MQPQDDQGTKLWGDIVVVWSSFSLPCSSLITVARAWPFGFRSMLCCCLSTSCVSCVSGTVTTATLPALEPSSKRASLLGAVDNAPFGTWTSGIAATNTIDKCWVFCATYFFEWHKSILFDIPSDSRFMTRHVVYPHFFLRVLIITREWKKHLSPPCRQYFYIHRPNHRIMNEILKTWFKDFETRNLTQLWSHVSQNPIWEKGFPVYASMILVLEARSARFKGFQCRILEKNIYIFSLGTWGCRTP